ncbi:hypothetical protein ACODM8_02925 [Vibrio ostreicida]|uniref:hypothetical protein n=1 Tax=Vibrio ostreicida TaxID=526588 RepID=UPI003B59D15B
MLNYQLVHRDKEFQRNNRLVQANKKRMFSVQPDLVIDFAQSPRLFFAKKYADILSSMAPEGIERIKNPFRPLEDLDAQIDIGTEQELETIDDIDYVFFHVFNRYDVLDKDATQWHCDTPSIGAVTVPVLDDKKLNAIPLQQRLLFKLDQDPSFLFVHDSVVDAMLNAKMQDIWVRWAD